MAREHDHHHHHHHVPAGPGRAFAVGVALNLGFVLVEVALGLHARSLALLGDAGHNFGDVLGLALSWGATALAGLRPSKRRTFGFRRSTIVASVINAFVLLFVTGGLTWEALHRLLAPQPTEGKTVVAVALAGVVVNGVSALLFLRDRHKDLNVRSAFLHLASDAALSLGVAVAGTLIALTGWTWLDPAITIALAATILAGTWSLMRRSMNLMLDAVPEGIDPEAVKAHLAGLPDVVEVHDLHIWAMSTTDVALTAHLVMRGPACAPSFLASVGKDLRDHFEIEHSTLQVESLDAPTPCALAPDEVV